MRPDFVHFAYIVLLVRRYQDQHLECREMYESTSISYFHIFTNSYSDIGWYDSSYDSSSSGLFGRSDNKEYLIDELQYILSPLSQSDFCQYHHFLGPYL